MQTLTKEFYNKYSTLEIARRLLGCQLVRVTAEGQTAGIIVETEAYLQDDPACHAYTRPTERNKSMFLKAGTSYVYLIYGLYHCFNVVTSPPGIGEAVLIRALQPAEGIQLMQQRRKTDILKNLCSGPGKLAKAMDINRSLDGHNLSLTPFFIEVNQESDKPNYDQSEIIITTRIGLTKGADLPYRFYVKDSPFISIK